MRSARISAACQNFLSYFSIRPPKSARELFLPHVLGLNGKRRPDAGKFAVSLPEERAVRDPGQIMLRDAEPLPENNILQRQADQNAADQERAAAAYRHYQDNIRAAGQLTTDIIKGLNTGQDIHDLFLMAVKAISCMTSDNYLYNHAEETIKTIYGVALGQYKPLQMELAAVEERLYNLEEAILWADAPDEKRRIENAIKWHRQRQSEIKEKLETTQL